jgi:hypothetical protein
LRGGSPLPSRGLREKTVIGGRKVGLPYSKGGGLLIENLNAVVLAVAEEDASTRIYREPAR